MTNPEKLVEKMAKAFNKNYPTKSKVINEIFKTSTKNALRIVLEAVENGEITSIRSTYRDVDGVEVNAILKPEFKEFLNNK